jgi:hypothetical protein
MEYAMSNAVPRYFTARLAAAYMTCGISAFPACAQVAETVLYSFLGHSDGSTPYAPHGRYTERRVTAVRSTHQIASTTPAAELCSS